MIAELKARRVESVIKAFRENQIAVFTRNEDKKLVIALDHGFDKNLGKVLIEDLLGGQTDEAFEEELDFNNHCFSHYDSTAEECKSCLASHICKTIKKQPLELG